MPQNSELQWSWRMNCSKGENKFIHIQIDSGTFQADKNLSIKAINVDNWNKIVWLSGLFCAIIRANLLTFHFIPGKFGANNRVVWLSMVWLSGLCCTWLNWTLFYKGIKEDEKQEQRVTRATTWGRWALHLGGLLRASSFGEEGAESSRKRRRYARYNLEDALPIRYEDSVQGNIHP